ncbi:restriction endonuclease subunit S [Photobacterium leiognathi]|uniref:Putative type I restriction-modification system specificity determinant n=1 Tax=Photobacterium leiognathi lrivu.4.1 TaxID=1248232 RepID=V5F5Y1_PHOLE|nr:restriction endonuclease subunit S [Photobacterium leiognathi]GAD31328.1 putative type I restriction-modification system specificity determinant [Photobacterium leiognathi lrivu.4.1]
MVPNGWEKLPLSELTKEKISYGIVQAGPHVENGIPYIKSSDVGGDIDILALQKTAPDIHHKYRRSAVHPNDIVFSLRGNIARTSIVPLELPEANLTQGTARISVNNQNDTKFVYYQLASEKVLNRINALSKGSTFKEISLEELRKVTLLQPPLPEQRKIAQILSTWDRSIATTEKLIDASKQQKKALMQQLLTGKKRLVDPETGKTFEGEWEEVKLGDVAAMNSGGTPKSSVSKYYDGIHPWVSIADMTKHGKWISKTEKSLTDEGISNSSARLYPKGTVLYAMYASIGECSISTVELCSSQAILGIRPKDNLINIYLYYYLVNLKEKIILTGQQGTQSNLNAGMVKGFNIKLPTVVEQQKIASVLTAADKEIELLETKLAHLKQEKKALMQQLLTGKRRVQVSETEAA